MLSRGTPRNICFDQTTVPFGGRVSMIVPDGESKSPRDFICPTTLLRIFEVAHPKRTYFALRSGNLAGPRAARRVQTLLVRDAGQQFVVLACHGRLRTRAMLILVETSGPGE